MFIFFICVYLESDVFNGRDTWWIGFYDDAQHDRYVWLDGTIVVWTNFNFEEPSNVLQQCVVLDYSNKDWYDRDCADKNYYICKKPSGEIIQLIDQSL